MRKYIIIALLIAKSSNIQAVVPNLDLVDSITAITLPRAGYDVSLTAYTEGSLLIKALIGLHDNFYLGASFDIEALVGNKQLKFNIPGVIAKLKFTDGWKDFPILIALGYDSFYLGEEGKIKNAENPFNRLIYGPYFVITKPIFLLGGEQHIHIGVRTPIQPVFLPENTAMYFAIDFPIGFFVPMFEINRIYFQQDRLEETLFNLGFKFNIVDNFSIELNFLIDSKKNINRVLALEYTDYF